MVIPCLILYLLSMLMIYITNQENVTLTYLDPKDPGGDVDRLLSLLDGEHYEVISSLQD